MKEIIKEMIREEMNRMNKTYYFMAGLPRSGSTLLSSILNQNPKFYSGPSSPVVPTMITLEDSLSNDELFLGYPKVQQAKEIIASVLPQYYSDRQEPVIFDKNRSWTIRMEYIPGYFDITPKVLCPVRDISEILTSFISMIRRNPYQVDGKINFIDEMLIKSNIPLTDDNRCEFLASPNGILGQSVQGLQKALMEGYDNSIHLIEYKDLVNKPKETMEKIYEFLGEEPFDHTFDNLQNINRENDGKIYGFADMHEVRPELKSTSTNPEEVLSEEILEKCRGTEFWRIIESNEDYFDEDDEKSEEFFVDEEVEEETELIGG
jgi:sulfotransferase